jgi:hypothetical protein
MKQLKAKLLAKELTIAVVIVQVEHIVAVNNLQEILGQSTRNLCHRAES